MKKLSNFIICIFIVFSLTGCSGFFNNIFYADTTNDPKEESKVEKVLERFTWVFTFKNNANGKLQITDLSNNSIILNYDGTDINGNYIVRQDGTLVFSNKELKYNIYLKDFNRNEKSISFQLGICSDYSTVNWESVSGKTDGVAPTEPDTEPENPHTEDGGTGAEGENGEHANGSDPSSGNSESAGPENQQIITPETPTTNPEVAKP